VVLFGAAVTAVLPGYRGEERRGRPAGRQFYEALELLGSLAQAQRAGRPPTLTDLVQRMHIAPDQVERMLERMERAGWIARGAGERWVLTRGAGELQVAEVYRAFVMDAGSLRADASAEMRAMHELLAAPRAGLEATLQIPVGELYEEPPSAEEPLRRSRVLEIIRRGGRA
jgi:membrane protein